MNKVKKIWQVKDTQIYQEQVAKEKRQETH